MSVYTLYEWEKGKILHKALIPISKPSFSKNDYSLQIFPTLQEIFKPLICIFTKPNLCLKYTYMALILIWKGFNRPCK